MRCPKCGVENVDTAKFCQKCGNILAIVTPDYYQQIPAPYPSPKKTPTWLVALIVVIVILIIGAISVAIIAQQPPKKPDLQVQDVNFSVDYYSDEVDVWATVTNEGDGTAYEPITLYFTVTVDDIPSFHTGTLSEASLVPGETANARWTFATDYQYSDSIVDVHFTKITWYE